MALERELATFRHELPVMLARGDGGKFALVHGSQVDSVWETRLDAIQAGYRAFGLTPFLVKPIQEQEEVFIVAGYSPVRSSGIS